MTSSRISRVLCRSATANDAATMKNFLMEHFIPNVDICRALGVTKATEGLDEFLELSIGAGVKDKAMIIAANQERDTVGISINHGIEDKPDFDQNSTSAPVTNGLHPMKNLEIFLTKIMDGFHLLIPEECKKVLMISILSVNKQCTGQGIGRQLLIASADNAKTNGFDAAIALSVSKASQVLFKKQGYEVLRAIRHEDFVNNDGTRLITCKDGTEEGQLVFLKL